MVVNLGFQVLFVIMMLVSVRYIANLYSLIAFAFLIHVAAGFTFNNFFTYCLSRFPKNAGIASGLTGGINYVIVSFLSYGIVSVFPAKDEYNLGFSYLALIGLSVLIMLLLRTKKESLSTV
jgi:MFS family permease